MARKTRSERASGNTILVVDDSPEYVETTRLTLEREGHRVVTATGGVEALEVLRTQHVDLVLLDYFMPGMAGEEVVKRLREFNSHVQVILQTGYASGPPRELLRRLDIQGYHDKSEGPDKLLLWTDVCLKAAYAVQLLYKSREGLRHILDVTPEMHRIQPLEELLQGILLQVSGLLGAANSFIAVMNAPAPLPPRGHEGFVAVMEGSNLVIRAGTGRFRVEQGLEASLDVEQLRRVQEALQRGRIELAEDVTIIPLRVGDEVTGVVYLDRPAHKDDDAELLTLLANQAAIAIRNAHVYETATLDPLTGVYGRQFLDQSLSRELRTARGSGQPLSLLMLDVDRFKEINDIGRVVGDKVLALMGTVLRHAIRGHDVAVRYGDDEFTLVLPGTGTEGAAVVAQRILTALDAASVDGPDGPVRVRASIGVVTLGTPPFSSREVPRLLPQEYFAVLGCALVKNADERVRAARRAGGHREQGGETVDWMPFPAESEVRPSAA